MKLALPLALVFAGAMPAFAQDTAVSGISSISFDVGLGAISRPKYYGADETHVEAWGTVRDLEISGFGGRSSEDNGFSILPNLNTIGPREEDDDDHLRGMDDISRAYEAGVKVAYHYGETTGYATVRKGFGGHHGVVGEFGADYRFKPAEHWTMWVGAEAKYGDSKFNDTYFGVTEGESVTSGYDEYKPGGGINAASARFEARYSLTDSTAVIGEVKYTRLLGDSADSPLVEKKSQPSIRLGVIHRLNFNF